MDNVLQYADLVAPVRAIAQVASERILEIYHNDFEIEKKFDNTPLTKADMAAHEYIVGALAKLTPDIPILSEEHKDISAAQRNSWDWLWLVDPLDGTREFIKRSDQFSINIALIHRHEAEFGLIFLPVDRLCYFAYRGGGAFKQAPNSKPQRIRTCSCSQGQQPVRVVGGRAVASERLQAYLDYVGRHCYLSVGSSLKSCLVAEGKFDLYPKFGPTSEWDTAAAQIIVEEAGGRVTDTSMRPLRYNARSTLINPHFFVSGDPSRDWSQYLLQCNSQL